jgi:hypothetical protein
MNPSPESRSPLRARARAAAERGARPIRARPTIVASAVALVLTGVLAASASAATPSASTGGASHVSFNSATLTGSVNPNGGATSYYFQYGLTHFYGGQTPILNAGAGTHTVNVAIPITGLQPLSVYHYRIVAVNGSGATIGKDRTLTTTKVPLSLQILASPNPVVFGGAIVVQGTLSGTGNANRAVQLQADVFPFTAGYQPFGNTQLTSAVGGFSFPVLNMTETTSFRVVTVANPKIVSPAVGVNVAVRIDSHVRRTGRSHFVRIFGTVAPAEDGQQVAILRIVHGRGVLVAGTVLRHRNATSSRFSKVVRVHPGVYRVLTRIVGVGQISNYGQLLVIR